MNRIGACANCNGDVLIVYFDAENGCRFCIGCGRRGPDAPLKVEVQRAFAVEEELTPVDFTTEEVTRISEPDPVLIAVIRGGRT